MAKYIALFIGGVIVATFQVWLNKKHGGKVPNWLSLVIIACYATFFIAGFWFVCSR